MTENVVSPHRPSTSCPGSWASLVDVAEVALELSVTAECLAAACLGAFEELVRLQMASTKHVS